MSSLLSGQDPSVAQYPSIAPAEDTWEGRVITTIEHWMRTPLDLPDELKSWLVRMLEVSDLTLRPDQVHLGPQSAVPIGAYFPFAGLVVPTYYLFCDGQAVARDRYSALFAAIGTVWGSGDGATTFNLPNIKGRVPVMRDAAQAEFDTIGEIGGAKTVALSQAEMPFHGHSIVADGSHVHTVGGGFQYLRATGGWVIGGNLGTGALFYGDAVNPVDSPAGTHSHGGGVGGTGGNVAHQNMPPYVVCNYIIRVE